MSVLFRLFDAINNVDFSFVDSLTDEEVSEVSAFVLTGWLSGADRNQSEHAIFSDMYFNRFVFKLSAHPRLLLKLAIAANAGLGRCKYRYVKFSATRESKIDEMIARYYKCSLGNAKQYKAMLTADEIAYIEELYEHE